MKHSARQGRVGMYRKPSWNAQGYRLATLMVTKRERKRTKELEGERPRNKGNHQNLPIYMAPT